MSIDFSAQRQSYDRGLLIESDIPNQPYELLKSWIQQAIDEKVNEPYAMSIATCGNDGKPSVRTVLMREVNQLDDVLSVVFYTNYLSQKGQDIEENNHVEVLFFWQELERQVRISGKVQKLSDEKSSAYFHKRPRDSQLAAWVSEPQSGVIERREVMESRFAELDKQYAETCEIPKPDFWGGYEIFAEEIEFWQGRANRMHDRILYSQGEQGNQENSTQWNIVRLLP